MTNVSLVAVRATDPCTEKRTGRRRDQRAPDGTTPQFLSSLFTKCVQVNSQKPIYAEPCIGPRYSDGFGRFEYSRPTTRTTIYIAHRHIRMRSGQYAAAREHANRRRGIRS